MAVGPSPKFTRTRLSALLSLRLMGSLDDFLTARRDEEP